MPTLHVRNVPAELYSRLQELAVQENRSLSAEVIALLEQAVSVGPSRRREVLQSIRRRRGRIAGRGDLPESLALLREDRDR